MITKDEIINSLQPINHIYFHIPDLAAYADKVIKFGKIISKRNESGELISYIIYYDNMPQIFITMIWTNSIYHRNGYAKKLLTELIKSTSKEITLEVNETNPAKYLYYSLNFVKVKQDGNFISMRLHQKSLAIMQPYAFPYIGYFNLIEASDSIVFYDDVNFIKKGWIHRNRILLNNNDFLFTIPVEKASQNKLIYEIKPHLDSKFLIKFFKQIEMSYKNAPFYDPVRNILDEVLLSKHENISDLAIKSIISVYNYLDCEFNWVKSSEVSSSSKGMPKADRLIEITKNLGYTKYINPQGGKDLYSPEYFKKAGIDLKFIQPQKLEYKQYNSEFIPWLSIIDVLMFNEKSLIKEMIKSYNLS